MGCTTSKQQTIAHVDDSVKVMLSHESKMAKKKGVPQSTTYIPRAEHPLLTNMNQNNNNNNTTNPDTNTPTCDETKTLPSSQTTSSATTTSITATEQ